MSDQPARRTPTAPAVADPPHARFNSLVAAAQVMTRPGMIPGATNRATIAKPTEWADTLWRHYDGAAGGEFRFGVTWVGNGLSRVNLVAARVPDAPGDEPTPIDPSDEGTTAAEQAAFDFVNAIGGSPVGQSQLMGAFGQHMSISGIGYLVVEPDLNDPEAEEYVTWQVLAPDALKMIKGSGDRPDRWEVNDCGKFRPAHRNALIVQVWRRHPRRPWEPDCPARAAITILEQLETLTLSITAVARSRLAGNGILAIPSEATFPPSQLVQRDDANDNPESPEPDPADLFVETLITTTVTPIKDQGSAAAVVPLVVQIPGEHLSKLVHTTFDRPNDADVVAKIEFAIKRLALALDMPPEVLLGMGDLTHWNAWQVNDTSITLHIEPNAEAICDGLTTGYLIPALEASGLDTTGLMVWYDASDLSSRPDKSAVTTDAYDRMEASGTALRREMGLSEDDAPDEAEKRLRMIFKALEIAGVQMAPVLLAELGAIPKELAMRLLEASMDKGGGGGGFGAGPADTPDPASDPQAPPDQPAPSDAAGPGDAAPAAAGAALLAACDGLVFRALERAGSRLRSAAGKKVAGGASAVDCPDPARLHMQLDATIYADLDHLLDGAWDRVPLIAARHGVDAEALTVTLNKYSRALLAAAHEHTPDRLAVALGLS